MKPWLVLLKSQDDGQYEEIACEHWRVIHAPVLNISPVSPDQVKSALFACHTPFDAVVFTSQRAILAMVPWIQQDERFQHIPAYALGQKTSQTLNEQWPFPPMVQLFATDQVPNTGTELALCLMEKIPAAKHILFPCGISSRVELPRTLYNMAQVHTSCLIVYTATPSPPKTLPVPIDEIGCIAYFSPNGVHTFRPPGYVPTDKMPEEDLPAFISYLGQSPSKCQACFAQCPEISSLLIASIGETTSETIRQHCPSPQQFDLVTAMSPTPAGLLSAISSHALHPNK